MDKLCILPVFSHDWSHTLAIACGALVSINKGPQFVQSEHSCNGNNVMEYFKPDE